MEQGTNGKSPHFIGICPLWGLLPTIRMEVPQEDQDAAYGWIVYNWHIKLDKSCTAYQQTADNQKHERPAGWMASWL